MEKKNNSNKKTLIKHNTNPNPFPKLKPKGSIFIHQIPPKSEKDNSSIFSKEIEGKSDFFSKLKFFQNNQGPTQSDKNELIKHSRTMKSSKENINIIKNLNSETTKEKKDKKDILSKKDTISEKIEIFETKEKKEDKKVESKNEENNEEIDNLNINLEQEKFAKRQISCSIENKININKEENNDIKDNKDNNNRNYNKKNSGKIALDYASKFLKNVSGYINDNVINKININFNLLKNEKSKESDTNSIYKNIKINFEKPSNFEEIEEHWKYEKILLDNDILDFTSKIKKYI